MNVLMIFLENWMENVFTKLFLQFSIYHVNHKSLIHNKWQSLWALMTQFLTWKGLPARLSLEFDRNLMFWWTFIVTYDNSGVFKFETIFVKLAVRHFPMVVLQFNILYMFFIKSIQPCLTYGSQSPDDRWVNGKTMPNYIPSDTGAPCHQMGIITNFLYHMIIRDIKIVGSWQSC